MLSQRFLRSMLCLRQRARSYVKCRHLSSQISKVSDGFVKDLRSIVGESSVTTSEAVRDQHSHDESYHQCGLPDVVVFAQNVGHVSQVAKLCNDTGVPLVPFGAGTGLEGGANAVQGGVSLDMSRMKNVVAVNTEDFDCTVEAGVTRAQLNSYIHETGLQFLIDPGADASLCGMCATSASGTNAVLYGTMRENTLNLEVVRADGTVFWTAGEGKRCKKTSAGYNLTNLFVGSEGTLGIITKATIRLHAVPEATLSAVVHFPGVQEAVDTTVQILQYGVPIARIEFLDDVAIDAFNKYSKFDMKVAPSLFLEFHGSEQSLPNQVKTVEEIAQANKGSGFKWATEAEERARLWKARHDMLYACKALVPGSKPYTTDVCVPISKLPEVILKTKELIKKANLLVPMVGHVGDGNFHCVFLGDPNSDHFYQQTKLCSHLIAECAITLNGTCTGEHGIGLGKRDLLEKEVGQDCIAAMKAIKHTFDPNNILNPGKIFK